MGIGGLLGGPSGPTERSRRFSSGYVTDRRPPFPPGLSVCASTVSPKIIPRISREDPAAPFKLRSTSLPLAGIGPPGRRCAAGWLIPAVYRLAVAAAGCSFLVRGDGGHNATAGTLHLIYVDLRDLHDQVACPRPSTARSRPITHMPDKTG